MKEEDTVEVYLTELEEQCYKMYCLEGKTMEQIAVVVYGDKRQAPTVSRRLKSVSKKLKKPLTKLYHKRWPQKKVKVKVRTIRSAGYYSGVISNVE